jgi:transposase-like protein
MSELSPKALKTVRRKGSAKGRHLTPAQKSEIQQLWRSGEVTLEELAKRFDKNISTIKNVLKGVKKGELASEVKKKVEEEVEKAIVDDATEYARRVKETRDEHYRMSAALAKLTYASIGAAKRDGIPLGNIAGDIKTLHIAAQTLKITREERFAVLGITNEDDNVDKPLPELVVQELTNDDIEELHQRQLMQEGDFGDDTLLFDEQEEDDRIETE